jgi:RNA polymerase sigma factor (sigma-70 family)
MSRPAPSPAAPFLSRKNFVLPFLRQYRSWMTEVKTDRELLREYVERGSEGAFRSLVERHSDLVFSTAFRGLGNAGTAQEITQNVFVMLARKAAWLRGETSLAAWLHKSALLEVRLWWRGELRRRRREQTAIELGTVMKDQDSLLKSLAGELDEGLLGLRESDRQALMLRFFEGRSHREIGALLGAREDAVRMRVEKALARLTRFFRRRGYSVPAVATTIAVLGATAKAAPAGLATAAARSALAAAGGGGLTGFKLYLAKFMGLTKTQTALLCAALAVAPIAWQWNVNRTSSERVAVAQAKLEELGVQQAQSSAELDRLRAQSARLDAELADVVNNQDRYEAAARKLEALKTRTHGLLTDAHYRWPDDLPYVRVPKKAVKSLNLLDAWPGTITARGTLTDPALEMCGITAQEKAPVEQALANYWRGVQELMAANAYETNLPSAQPGRLTKTVIVPPLGQPMTTLADEIQGQLTGLLGADREQLLFAGWDQGGIQVFWPGNLWNIAAEAQTFDAWIEPATGNAPPRYGAGWHHQSGSGWSSEEGDCVGGFPQDIATKFFTPWLGQFGVTAPSQYFGRRDREG